MSTAKAYSALIKFGRTLENYHYANKFSDEHPELVLSFVRWLDKELKFTRIDDFFSLFPPIKEYHDDGTWDYKSTMKMRKERLGTHFGKDDLKHLLMSSCYENKWVQLVGIAFIWSISRSHEKQTGRNLMFDFLESQGVKTFIYQPKE